MASLVKQRRDSIEQFTKGGRKDLADKETAEIAVLEAYLPPAVDAARARGAVAAAIARPARLAKDMGSVMKAVMAELAGKNVDGKAVNELVRRKLGSLSDPAGSASATQVAPARPASSASRR